MHSVKLTMAKILMVLFVACGLQMSASAQENSPYSRYGLGDLTPNHNILSRGMGGIAAGIADNRSINFTNPASLTNIYNTIFDVGIDITYRTLKNKVPAKKFTSANTYISYLQMAFPLSTPKMIKKKNYWAMSLGIRPVSNIGYKIQTAERTAVDSIETLYEGSGGVNQAFLGTAIKIKNLSIGVNAGYMFGNKNHSTIVDIINDSASFHYTSNSATKTTFGGLFFNAGLQYNFDLQKNEKGVVTKNLNVGVYGNLQQNLKAKSDKIREIVVYDGNGGIVRLDSVYEEKDVKGDIKYPAMLGFGFTYQDLNWMYGFDVEYGNWSSFRSYGQKDAVQNSLTFRAGAQYYPAKENTPVKKYFNFVKYRAGLYYGSDYIKTTVNRPEYGVTLGAGFPMTTLRKISWTGEYVVLNTALEFGSRGNKQTNLRESIFRFSFGVSMNARWFQKPKYN